MVFYLEILPEGPIKAVKEPGLRIPYELFIIVFSVSLVYPFNLEGLGIVALILTFSQHNSMWILGITVGCIIFSLE